VAADADVWVAVIVYWRVPPAATVVGLDVFLSEKLASFSTVVDALILHPPVVVHPAPVQDAVFVTTSVGSPAFAATENVRAYEPPGATPLVIVQTISLPSDAAITEHVEVPLVPDGQAAEPDT